MIQVETLRKRSKMRVSHSILAGGCLAMVPFLAGYLRAQDHSEHNHYGRGNASPAKLVEMVRQTTQQFTDVNAATAANYQPFLGCVTGPDHGAMGIHYVNGDLVSDGQIDVAHPEALIYEPVDGGLQLVGVEFIVDAATWLAHNSGAPVLDGQVFQLVDSPNRFGLAPFFELHVWAWRDNPNGAFVDWNTRVTCEGQ